VGWLSYWLFLVYADNPSVASELSSSLQRFPQLSFSTIDIAVMVIIAALAVTLAFKFQRGLRPGIRLERALQMLESLMKRNLVLEAQVAELKIEKSHAPPVITSIPTPSTSTPEPRVGSWEKAFRTPLEAGPPIAAKSSSMTTDQIPFGNETGVPPRIELPKTQAKLSPPKPQIIIDEKGSDRTSPPPMVFPEKPVEKSAFANPPKSSAANWEDSPQFTAESKGILTPSSARKAPPVSDSGGLKQPYIPAPAPKPTPAGIVASPVMAPPPRSPTLSTPPRITARPTARTTGQKTTTALPTSTLPPVPQAVESAKPEGAIPPSIPPPVSLLEKSPSTENVPVVADTSVPKPAESDITDERSIDKLTAPTRKRASLES
jgi:hypothetical protein